MKFSPEFSLSPPFPISCLFFSPQILPHYSPHPHISPSKFSRSILIGIIACRAGIIPCAMSMVGSPFPSWNNRAMGQTWDHYTLQGDGVFFSSSLVQTVTEIVVYKISGVSGSQIANCTSFINILTTEVLTT